MKELYITVTTVSGTRIQNCKTLAHFSEKPQVNLPNENQSTMTSNKSKKKSLTLTNKRKTSPLQDVSQNVVSKKQKTTTTTILPEPQGRIAKPHVPIQCWAHSKTTTATRCRHMVTTREGEPIPIPYCDVHLKSGDGALRRVAHPTCGYALVARYDLPAQYRMVLWGQRGRCPTSDKEDRSISYYPPNPKTGRNTVPFTNIKKTDNYNGVLNPKDTGDLLQFASCPGPNERQNMR